MSEKTDLMNSTIISASKSLGKLVGFSFLIFLLYYPIVNSILGAISSDAITLILVFTATVVFHELIHALSAMAMGVKVSFGLWKVGKLILGFYVRLSESLELKKWLVVALSPLLLSLVSLILAFFIFKDFFAWLSIANTVGSAGDLMLVLFAIGSGRDAKIKDEGDAIVIKNGSPSPLSTIFLNLLASTGYILVFSLLFTSFLILSAPKIPVEISGILMLEVKGGELVLTSNYVFAVILVVFVFSTLIGFRSLKRLSE